MRQLCRLAIPLLISVSACGSAPPIAAPVDRFEPLQLTFNTSDVQLLGTGAVTLDGKPFLTWTGRSFTDTAGNTVVKVDADGTLWGLGMHKHPHFTSDDRVVSEDGSHDLVVAPDGTVTLLTAGTPVPGTIKFAQVTTSSRRTAALLVLATLVRTAIMAAQEAGAHPADVERPDPVSGTDLDGIKAVDATHVTIPKALLARLLGDADGLARGARIVPDLKDGKPHGFKLFGIRPDSVYARIGLANGDTVVELNGFALDTADHVLEVYTKVREAWAFELVVLRQDKPMTIQISGI
jgi:hypothetical protein